MSSLAELAEYYRLKAADLRKRAERAGSDMAQAAMMESARSWDKLADKCEAEIAAYRGRL